MCTITKGSRCPEGSELPGPQPQPAAESAEPKPRAQPWFLSVFLLNRLGFRDLGYRALGYRVLGRVE